MKGEMIKIFDPCGPLRTFDPKLSPITGMGHTMQCKNLKEKRAFLVKYKRDLMTLKHTYQSHFDPENQNLTHVTPSDPG